MKPRTALALAGMIAAAVLILAWVFFVRMMSSRSPLDATQAAIRDFTAALGEHRRRHGHLPGDVDRDGEIDAVEAAATVSIGGRTVILRAVGRRMSSVPNLPRGRNVIELWGVPCALAQELDSRIDDGSLAKGSLRAGAASCAPGAEESSVPLALAVP